MEHGGFHAEALLSYWIGLQKDLIGAARSCRAHPKPDSSLSLGFVGPRNESRKCPVVSLAVNSDCPQAV